MYLQSGSMTRYGLLCIACATMSVLTIGARESSNENIPKNPDYVPASVWRAMWSRFSLADKYQYFQHLVASKPSTITTDSTPDITAQIVGGSQVTIEQYPYQVSLSASGPNGHFCGGSLISSSYVLTAAHCMQGAIAAQLQVRLGSSDRTSGGQVIGVSQVVVNPNYNSKTFDYDAAILKLAAAADTTKAGTKTIALSPAGLVLADGTNVTTSGWGTTSSGAMSIPKFLRAVTVPIVSRDKCTAAYKPAIISDRMICAGQVGKDSCQGDSGGPLMCVISGVKTLVGVVSWGYGCADYRYPGVYSNVASLREWIKSIAGV